MDLKTAAVEPMTRPSLEQMLATIPQQSQSLLGQKVSDTHLDEIARALTDWRSVCTKLGISEPEEEAIKEENQTTAAQRLAVLRRWRSKYGVNATYRNLANCFYSADKLDVVETVCQALGAHSSFVMGQQEEYNPAHMSGTSSSQELHSASRHECNNTSTASGTNAELTFCRQPPFQQLSPSKQEELKIILDGDVREMKRLFGCLVTKTHRSVKDRISVEEFAVSMLALGAYEPAPEEQGQPVLNEHRAEIKRAESIAKIFNILCAYWNYLNYEILEYIIELYGTSDDIERLKSYDEKLQNFCKRRIFELPLPESGSSTGNNPRQEELSVKLDVHEDITVKELRRIKERIAKSLHVKPATLLIHRIDTGCVQLTFLIPNFVAQKIFPLSKEQTAVLSRDVSVVRMVCGDYVSELQHQVSQELDQYLNQLTDEKMDKQVSEQILARASCFITERWKMTGCFLGLTEVDISKISHDYSQYGVEECAYQSFLKWNKQSPDMQNTTIRELIKILYKSREYEAIDKVILFLKNNTSLEHGKYLSQLTDEEKDKQVSEQILARASCYITGRWQMTGRFLGLTEVDISKIFHDYSQDGVEECLYQSLLKWKKQSPTGQNTTVRELIKILHESREREAIKKIILFLHSSDAY